MRGVVFCGDWLVESGWWVVSELEGGDVGVRERGVGVSMGVFDHQQVCRRTNKAVHFLCGWKGARLQELGQVQN